MNKLNNKQKSIKKIYINKNKNQIIKLDSNRY